MKTNSQVGIPKPRKKYGMFCGVRIKDRRLPESQLKKPPQDRPWKLESVTLARMAALGL